MSAGEKRVNAARKMLDELSFGGLPSKKKVEINLDDLIKEHHPDNRIVRAHCTRDIPRIQELESMVFSLASAFKATLVKEAHRNKE